MISDPEQEIVYWKEMFEEALSELKQTHVNVYRFTIGRPPSPLERARTISILKKDHHG